jgi:hypothetical protein
MTEPPTNQQDSSESVLAAFVSHLGSRLGENDVHEILPGF